MIFFGPWTCGASCLLRTLTACCRQPQQSGAWRMKPSPESTVTHSRSFSHHVRRFCSCQSVFLASMSMMSFRWALVRGAEQLCTMRLRECEDTRNDRASSERATDVIAVSVGIGRWSEIASALRCLARPVPEP